MEATLKLVQFGPVTEGQSAKGPWRKGIVIFETIGDYPKKIAVNFFNTHLEEASKFNLGDTCKVKFDISSRKWDDPKTREEKWFTDINGFGIEADGQQAAPQPQQQPQPRTVKQANMFDNNNGDDLPFDSRPY